MSGRLSSMRDSACSRVSARRSFKRKKRCTPLLKASIHSMSLLIIRIEQDSLTVSSAMLYSFQCVPKSAALCNERRILPNANK